MYCEASETSDFDPVTPGISRTSVARIVFPPTEHLAKVTTGITQNTTRVLAPARNHYPAAFLSDPLRRTS